MKRQAAKQQLPASDDPSVTQTSTNDDRWEDLFGCPSSRRSSLIDQAIAWKEQVMVQGDVPKHILRDLRILAHQVGETRRHPGSSNLTEPAQKPAPRSISENAKSSATPEKKPVSSPPAYTAPPTTLLPASSQLSAGARLVKHYGGETHVVEVTADGMLYRGQTYATLSGVAKVITGTHWNGLLFFGLRRRKTYARKANG